MTLGCSDEYFNITHVKPIALKHLVELKMLFKALIIFLWPISDNMVVIEICKQQSLMRNFHVRSLACYEIRKVQTQVGASSPTRGRLYCHRITMPPTP